MKSLNLAVTRVSIQQNILATFIAIGLGVTLPRIFHLFGLGHIFLPMFVPMAIVGLFLGLPYLLVTAVVTPFLSTLLFGMPPWTVTPVIAVQLTIIGSLQWLLKQTKLSMWAIVPASVLAERILTIVVAMLIPALGITSSAILASYPGVIILMALGFLVSKINER